MPDTNAKGDGVGCWRTHISTPNEPKVCPWCEVERLRLALRRIAYPDGDEAAFYDWSVAEKIARSALDA